MSQMKDLAIEIEIATGLTPDDLAKLSESEQLALMEKTLANGLRNLPDRTLLHMASENVSLIHTLIWALKNGIIYADGTFYRPSPESADFIEIPTPSNLASTLLTAAKVIDLEDQRENTLPN